MGPACVTTSWVEICYHDDSTIKLHDTTIKEDIEADFILQCLHVNIELHGIVINVNEFYSKLLT